MDEEINLVLYNVQQVKDWLLNNAKVEGLSEEIIDKQRAYAIINNPYATDELNIISALFVGTELAAYSCLMPDKVTHPINNVVYWATTLFCKPKYQGRGYAYYVIGQFAELYGERYFDLNALDETNQALILSGLKVDYAHKYLFTNKSINTHSLLGKVSYLANNLLFTLKSHKKSLIKKIDEADLTYKYVRFVDQQLYEFIQENSKEDLFLRSKEMFNWILTYTFLQSSPLKNKVNNPTFFVSEQKGYQNYAVCVYSKDTLIGFFILTENALQVSLKYLYFKPEFKNMVYLSVADHVLSLNRPSFLLTNEGLYNFLLPYKIYPKTIVEKRSFAFPQQLEYSSTLNIQGGDGDNFA